MLFIFDIDGEPVVIKLIKRQFRLNLETVRCYGIVNGKQSIDALVIDTCE